MFRNTHYSISLVILTLLAVNKLESSSRNPFPVSVDEDIETILICERGVIEQIDYILANDSLWGLNDKGLTHDLKRDEKQDLVDTWTGLLDYFAHLDHIQNANSRFYRRGGDEIDPEIFYCYYLAFLTQYRYALELLVLLEKNENIHIYLNEAQNNEELNQNLYTNFKYHFLNVFLATKFVALKAVATETPLPEDLIDEKKIKMAEDYLYAMGQGEGTRMTFENGARIMRDAAFELWLPLQQGVSSFMGGKKVWRVGKSLVSVKDVKQIEKLLEPGDIIFTRKEWALTNLGLPGFWTHTALYIGTPEKRKEYFSGDSIDSWIKNKKGENIDFEHLLSETYSSSYDETLSPDAHGRPIQIIESIKPGVIFNSLETTLSCDGVAVLRPMLSTVAKANAIFQAFQYLGRPYDLNFDFRTDSALVCSELILKAYESMTGINGLTMRTVNIGNRVVTPANLMIRQFSEEYGTPQQQLEFVVFYDGHEKNKRAILSTREGLEESWKRPDWHIFTQ